MEYEQNEIQTHSNLDSIRMCVRYFDPSIFFRFDFSLYATQRMILLWALHIFL